MKDNRCNRLRCDAKLSLIHICLAVGYWANKEEVIKNWAIDRTFTPEISEEKRNGMVTGWNKACLLYTSRCV